MSKAVSGLLAFLLAAPLQAQFGAADRHFEEGRKLYRRKNYAGAMRHLTQALAHQSHNKEILAYVARTAAKLKEQEQKNLRLPLSELEEIVAGAQEVLRARRRRMGKVVDQLRSAYKQSAPDEGAALLKACRGIDIVVDVTLGSDPESQLVKQYVRLICGNLEKALRQGPGAAERFKLRILGYLAYCRSRWEEAVLHWESALRADPEDADLRKLLDRARNHFDRERISREVELLGLSARRHENQGRYDQAVEEYRSALSLDGSNEAARKALEQAQRRLAEEARRRTIAEAEALARRYEEQGEWVEAANVWLKVLELDPFHAKARRSLVKNRGRIERMAEGLSASARPGPAGAARRRAVEAQRLYVLGLIQYQQGELKKAEERFAASAKLDPGDEQARRALERVRREREGRP